jgi:hypothetical protein
MYRLSICANTIFLDLPFEKRLKEIAKAGFLVEFWGWKEHNLDIFAGIEVCGFSGTQGGSCVHPDGLEDYVAGIAETTPVGKKLGRLSWLFTAGSLAPTARWFTESLATRPPTGSPPTKPSAN